jgi:hypothetical protein
MILRTRAVLVTALLALTTGILSAPAAQAGVLSLLPGSCGAQPASQPFAPWGDFNDYTMVPGGDFEPGAAAWSLTGGAAVQSESEPLSVDGAGDSYYLALPPRSTATSPASCTSIYDPTVRLFVRNTGNPASQLTVQALYPGLLGGVQTATLGELTGSSSWEPSRAMDLTASNLLATLSLDQTVIAFRFMPADASGTWSIDDVYVDPFGRS